MNKLNKKILLIALILALVTTYAVYMYLKKIENAASNLQYEKIIVAAKDIPARTKITSSMLKEVKVLKGSHVIDSVQEKSKIIGKYTKEKILKDEVIPLERLMEDENEDLSLRIPEGKRAISISVNEISGVADLIKPGDYVDVFVTVNEKIIEDKYNRTVYPEITKLLLQNIQVMAISKEMNRSDGQRKETPDRYSLTLAVPFADGEKIVLAEEIGRLKVALRPYNEHKSYETPGTVREDLVPNKGVKVFSK